MKIISLNMYCVYLNEEAIFTSKSLTESLRSIAKYMGMPMFLVNCRFAEKMGFVIRRV